MPGDAAGRGDGGSKRAVNNQQSCCSSRKVVAVPAAGEAEIGKNRVGAICWRVTLNTREHDVSRIRRAATAYVLEQALNASGVLKALCARETAG